MTVTLAVDVGDEERVVLVPRKGDEFASVGTVANVVERVRLPGGGRAVALEGEHRARIGAAQHRRQRRPARRGRAASRRRAGRRAHPQPRARVPRRGRGDPRAARRRRSRGRVRALDHRARRAGRHHRLLARPDLRAEGRAARDARRDRAARAGAEAPARAAGRAAGAHAHPRRRPVRRREAAARVLPAQADGVDPQGARRRRRLGRRGVPRPRSRRPACPTTCASRPSASWAGSSAWASRAARPR